MTFRASTQVISDLAWWFNESQPAIAGLRSTWQDVVIVKGEATRSVLVSGHWYDAPPLRCGPIYVPKQERNKAAYELDGKALAAARREAPILDALRWAGEDVFEALRHRYREKMLVCREHVPEHLRPLVSWDRKGCRVPFGLEGIGLPRGGPMDGCLGVMLNPLRGCGGAAHLTTAARAAYAQDRLRLRVRLDVAGWLDRLGGRICQGEADDDEVALGRELRRQAEAMVYGEGGALDRYGRTLVRRRRAS